MSARTSRYTGISAWLAASARASSRLGVQCARPDLDALPAPTDCSLIWFLSSLLNCALRVPGVLFRPALSGGAGRQTLSDRYLTALAFMPRLTSRAWAIDSAESTSATECQVAACFSQPGGLTSNFLARIAMRIF